LPTILYVIPKCKFQLCYSSDRNLDPLHNSEWTTLKGKTTTNNKGKRIFPYQLRSGIFEQDLVHAK
jgi:hypothetical protein